jgi:hypothetical protein
MPRPDRHRTAAVAAALVFFGLAWPGASERGIIAEEVQPYLRRHPVVLEEQIGGRAIVPMPPAEPAAPPPPRWVSTSQWPQLAYDGSDRQWPLLIRGHQSALGAYPGLLLGPALGGGIAGIRRSTVLMGLAIVWLTLALSRRLGGASPLLAALVLAASFGMVAISRTGYGYEVASRLAMVAALATAARPAPPSRARALAVGALAGVAVICRATVALALVPALAALWWPRARRPPAGRAALGVIALVAVPAIVLAVAVWVTPPRPDSLPLANFPWADLRPRLAGAPRQGVILLAWLADATAIWRPVARGDTSLGAVAAAATLGALPMAAAAARVAGGRAGDGERMFLAALGSSIVGGALLYGSPNQFQLALPLEPLFAIAVAEQLPALPAAGPRAALTAGVLAWRAFTAGSGLALDGRTANPMLSGACQRAAVAHLTDLGVSGERILTTTYNHAGVIEAWSDERLRPVHAWPLLRTPPGDDARLDPQWARLLERYRPEIVVLTDGRNLFESHGMDPPAIGRSLARVSAARGVSLTDAGRFPTESGTPGWALVRLAYPSAP